jgi:hypothetical protein
MYVQAAEHFPGIVLDVEKRTLRFSMDKFVEELEINISCRTKLCVCDLLRNLFSLEPLFCYQKTISWTPYNPSFSIYFINYQLVDLVRQALFWEMPERR